MSTMTSSITKEAAKILLAKVPKDRRKSVLCSLIGHSRIVSACFGYIHCGRCDAQIADKLGGSGYSQAENCVQIGHNCETCRKNYRKMDWRDKWLVANPFKEAKR